MSEFLDDIRSQEGVLRHLLEAYRGRLRPQLDLAADLLDRHPDRPVLVVGMGSSLFAGASLAGLLGRRSRIVVVEDAGELLHYRLESAARAGAIVAISQSGRSIETIRVVEALRGRNECPILALVNDEASPLAAAADVVLPMLAGSEGAISTKTYTASLAALIALGDVRSSEPIGSEELDRAVDAAGRLATDESVGRAAADHLGDARALIVLGRGPAVGVAAYGALAIKEAAAMPAEAMSGGAFRHGPIELVGGDLGVIVLAPAGRTTDLLVGIATQTAELGTPTWLITDAGHASTMAAPANLLVSPLLPDVAEDVAPLALAVPLQLMAAALADRVGRSGTTVVASKVTDRE